MTAKTAPTNEVAELDWDRDLEGYEVQETDIGEKIDWKDEIGFKGVYKGTNVVEVLDEGSGEMTFVKIHQFKDEAGGLRFSWSTPRLDRGLQHGAIGDEVGILWTGKEDLAGGRTLNTFKVALKKAPAPALPA